jgi:two-component system sensor histidine kinase NreB
MKIDVQLQSKARRWSQYFAIAILAIAAMVLAGWQFNIRFLLHPLPKLAVMNPVTALCFALFGGAFLLKSRNGLDNYGNRLSNVFVAIVLIIAVARYLDWHLNTNFNLDSLLYPNKIIEETSSELHRRMGPPAALALIFACISLLFIHSETRRRTVLSQSFAMAVGFVGFVSFLIYLYDVSTFSGSLEYVPMAIHTAVCLMLISLSLLFYTMGHGLMRGLSTQFAGSIMARRFIPFVIILPVLFGMGRLYFEHKDGGGDSDDVLITLSVALVIVTLLVFVSYITRSLNKRDLDKTKAEEALSTLNAELEEKVGERTKQLMETFRQMYDYRHALDESSIVAVTDQKGIITYANDNFCRISKYTRDELIGQDHRLVNSGYHSKEFMNELWTTIGRGKIWRGEVCNKAKDGMLYWVDTTIVPFVDDKGRPYQYMAVRSDITDKKKSEQEILKMTSELRHLLEHVQNSREEERKYIAREIHDELGQRLTALKIDLAMMQKKILSIHSVEILSAEVAGVMKELDSTLQSVKRISTDLRPEILDHLDILEAVKWQAEQFQNITGIPCKVFYNKEDFKLQPDASTAVYRIVQESLTNVTRHAKATIVSISLEASNGKMTIEVNDNGSGIAEKISQNKKSFGIIGMRERMKQMNGSFSISSFPGKGTTVIAEIPYKSSTE